MRFGACGCRVSILMAGMALAGVAPRAYAAECRFADGQISRDH